MFGIKGGAAGGGYSQVIPMEDFNLHLTGDVHAIGAAHNLAAAFIDNHIYHGNQLEIDPARSCGHGCSTSATVPSGRSFVGLGSKENGYLRQTGFVITVASEVMAILALASDLKDVRARLGRIVLGTRRDGTPVTAEDLKVAGAMAVLLKDAIKPNLMQTLEGGPALVHCGPFGNIAHGNNSIVADRAALAGSDIVVTEAGFGADMGAEKFVDIKCRTSGLRPDAAVVVATVRALKMHGGVGAVVAGRPLDPALLENNPAAVTRGAVNLVKHLEIVRAFGLPAVVAINVFPSDTREEIAALREAALAAGAEDAVESSHFVDGGDGAKDLARAVWAAAQSGAAGFRLLYPDDVPLRTKIETIATQIYGADGVDFLPSADKALSQYEAMGFGGLPVCMAKTHVQPQSRPFAARPPDRLPAARARRVAVRGRGLRHRAVWGHAHHARSQQPPRRRAHRHRRRRKHRGSVLITTARVRR